MKNIFFITLFLQIFIIGCTSEKIQNSYKNEEIVINTFSETGIGSVNSFWFETKDGIVLIDTQRSLSSASELLKEIKKTNKPVIAILLTHAHPDHFGGLSLIKKEYPNAQIYSSIETAQSIKSDKQNYIKLSKQVLGDDFSDDIPVPNLYISDGDLIEFDGITLEVENIGSGEAENMTIFYYPDKKILFSGDLIGHNMTPFLLEGRSKEWLNQLDYIQSKYGDLKIIYPGHGKPGDGFELISSQKTYILKFRELIAENLKNENGLNPTQKKEILEKMQIIYAGYLPVAAIPKLLELNIDAIEKEILNER